MMNKDSFVLGKFYDLILEDKVIKRVKVLGLTSSYIVAEFLYKNKKKLENIKYSDIKEANCFDQN